MLCSIISSRADTAISSVSFFFVFFFFFQNLGADITDPVDTTRTAMVIYGLDPNCYGYNGKIRKTASVASVYASVC